MSAHPAYPTARDLRIETAAQRIIDADLQAAQQMREALTIAAEKIKALKFATGCPVIGYDLHHVLEGLADMMPPPDSMLYSQVEHEALALARDAEADRDRDAAECRAELARDGVC